MSMLLEHPDSTRRQETTNGQASRTGHLSRRGHGRHRRQSLKDWDKLDDDVKLNAIGVLVLDEKGKIKAQKIGRRSWGKGAGIGVVLAAIGAAHTACRAPSPVVCSAGCTTKVSGSTARA